MYLHKINLKKQRESERQEGARLSALLIFETGFCKLAYEKNKSPEKGTKACLMLTEKAGPCSALPAASEGTAERLPFL